MICFWGFVNLNENARDDVLDCLRESLVPEPEPVVINEPEPEQEQEPAPVVTFEQADAPLITPVATVRITEDELYTPEPVRMNAAPPEPAPAAMQKNVAPLWLLPVAAVIIAAIATAALAKTGPDRSACCHTSASACRHCSGPVKTVEPLELKLPLHRAEVVEPKVKTPAPAAEPVVITAIPKDAMVMEANPSQSGVNALPEWHRARFSMCRIRSPANRRRCATRSRTIKVSPGLCMATTLSAG